MHQICAINDLSYLVPRELSDLALTPSSFMGVRDHPVLNAVGCIRPSLCWLHGGFPVELEGQMSAFNHYLHEIIQHDSLLGRTGWAWWYSESSALWHPALPFSGTPHICSSFLSRVHSQLASSCLPKKCQFQNKGMITGAVWLESCRAQQLPGALAVAVLSVMFHFTFAWLCAFALSSLLFTSSNQAILWLSSAKFFVDFNMTEVEKITYYK